VKIPLALHFARSLPVIAVSRLKSSCSMARARHLGWKAQTAQCLFKTSAGGSRLLRVALIASMVWRVRTTWPPILTVL
jgi:hypothetical protein